METFDIDKIYNDAEYWNSLAPWGSTHYDPNFKAGQAWRRVEEDGRWFGKHPDGGWYCFSPMPEQVKNYIVRPQ